MSGCPLRVVDRSWIVIMAIRVNLKKYLAIGGRWQFVPVLKIDGKPDLKL